MHEVHASLSTIAISLILHTLNEALIFSKIAEDTSLILLLLGRCVIGAASMAILQRLSNDKTGVDPLFNIFITIMVPVAVHQFWT